MLSLKPEKSSRFLIPGLTTRSELPEQSVPLKSINIPIILADGGDDATYVQTVQAVPASGPQDEMVSLKPFPRLSII